MSSSTGASSSGLLKSRQPLLGTRDVAMDGDDSFADAYGPPKMPKRSRARLPSPVLETSTVIIEEIPSSPPQTSAADFHGERYDSA